MRKTGIALTSLICLMGAAAIMNGQDASAATTPKLNFTKKTFTISVGNGQNYYEDDTIKITNKKRLIIKKIKFKSKDEKTATVYNDGYVYGRRAGKTKIIVTVKYKNKEKEDWKTDKKRISITVKNDLLVDIPQTEMQYDENGCAKPIYPFTKLNDTYGTYSNEASYIKRFPVYVETDYDTDLDGKRDLVMALVQVPQSAVDGYYKAPAIFEANPYFELGDRYHYPKKAKNNSFNYDLLTTSPEPRQPLGETSTAEAAREADDWVEEVKTRLRIDQIDDYNYFLTRGYASVTSPGPGGSGDCEGLQLCGEKVEAEDYAAIVEWLHGDRVAYADKAGTKQIKADWCNGHTAMTGFSYNGALAYEVATLGVEGLDTIIPGGGISSWYNYVYSQGALRQGELEYMSFLGNYCAKRFNSTEEGKVNLAELTYNNYLYQKNYDTCKEPGVYDWIWERYAFHRGGKIKVPALIFHGMNEVNVSLRQAVVMRDAFKKAGQPVKLILHQGEHNPLCDESKTILVNGEPFVQLFDRWLAHTMAGVDNGIDKMADYTVQSNVDGSWETFNEDRATGSFRMEPSTKKKESTLAFGQYLSQFTSEGPSLDQIKADSLVWEQKITEDTVLAGHGEVHLRLKMPSVKKNNPYLGIYLYDEFDKKFNAFVTDPDYGSGVGKVGIDANKVIDIGKGLNPIYEASFVQKPTKGKRISEGRINLLLPDSGWEPESNVKPVTPLKKDTWYDYTVHLEPNIYKIKKGHTLRLYIVTPTNLYLTNPKLVDKYTEKLSTTLLISTKYQFTIDNINSYFSVPTYTE